MKETCALFGACKGNERQKLLSHFILVIKALNHPKRRAILRLLRDSDVKEMPFSKIKRMVGGIRDNQTLAYHLDILERAHLIVNIREIPDKRSRKNPFYSFYALTKFGLALLPRLNFAFSESFRSAGLLKAAEKFDCLKV